MASPLRYDVESSANNPNLLDDRDDLEKEDDMAIPPTEAMGTELPTNIEKPRHHNQAAPLPPPQPDANADLKDDTPRSSGSTSAAPCSSGRSTADPLVDPPEDHTPTLTGRPLAILIAGLLTSSLVVAIDQMIVATALPVLSSEFSALAQLPWVVNGFFLTQATGTLTYGQLYTLLSAKYTFLASILIFEIGSVLSAVATAFWVLVLGRAVSGLGAAGLVVGMHTIVGQVVRLQDRTIHYTSLGVVFSAASVCGPLLGGVFTDKVTWRWCFWINLPIGAVGAIAIYFALPPYEVRLPSRLRGKPLWCRWTSIDWVGNFFALGMTTSLMLALQWGGVSLPWNDRVIIALFILSGITLGLFLWWEIHATHNGLSMVPMKLFKNRSVSGAAISGFFLHILFGVAVTYFPLYYQSRGSSALQSGIDILPFVISSVVFVVFAGLLVKRIGNYKFWIVAGPWVASIGAGFLIDKTLLAHPYFIVWQLLIGSGFGVAFQNTMMAVQAEFALDTHLIPQASSIVGFCQRTGPMIGISIAGAVFSNSLDRQLPSVPSLSPSQMERIKQSVQYVWSATSGLTDAQKSAVVEIFIDSLRHALFVMAPAAVISGAAALLVKNWNLRKRGPVATVVR